MKVRPEKISGIVALSYLVLIPAGGAWLYLKMRAMDQDINTIWNNAEIPPTLAAKTPLEVVRDGVKGRNATV